MLLLCYYRDRPAAIAIEIKSIDDTFNFDEFPDVDLKWRIKCIVFTYVELLIVINAEKISVVYPMIMLVLCLEICKPSENTCRYLEG
jgi:hypothetical protein